MGRWCWINATDWKVLRHLPNFPLSIHHRCRLTTSIEQARSAFEHAVAVAGSRFYEAVPLWRPVAEGGKFQVLSPRLGIHNLDVRHTINGDPVEQLSVGDFVDFRMIKPVAIAIRKAS